MDAQRITCRSWFTLSSISIPETDVCQACMQAPLPIDPSCRPPLCCIWDKFPQWAWSPVTKDLQGPTCLHPTRAGVTGSHYGPSFLHEFWGSEPISLCWWGSHFTDWTFFSATSILLKKKTHFTLTNLLGELPDNRYQCFLVFAKSINVWLIY